MEPKAKWKLRKYKEGIKIYTRTVKGSYSKEFLGKTSVNNLQLSSLVLLYNDYKAYTDWMHYVKKALVIKKIDKWGNKRLIYTILKLPWPMTQRDQVTMSKLSQKEKNKNIIIRLVGKSYFNYRSKQRGLLRIPKIDGYWIFKPSRSRKIDISYRMHLELGGNIPPMMRDRIAIDLPFYTLRNMKKILKNEKYRNVKKDSSKKIFPWLID